ncbi:MAG: hypothetical protein QM729_21225 [Solirubrobacterales bacterium]
MTQKAYSVTTEAAYAIVQGAKRSVLYAIQTGEVADEGQLNDEIGDVCDRALTYTADQYACVWGLADADTDEFGRFDSFEQALGIRAYANLKMALEECSDEFEAALAVANDARAEAE